MASEVKSPEQQAHGKRPWLSKRLLVDLAVAFGVALVACLIWITNSDLWTRANWDIPPDYAGDTYQILGWIKAASEGDYHLFDIIYVSRLGAPFGANWNDYPMYEKAFTLFLGWLARSIGIMAAANTGMMLTHATAAASFYLACRWFRWNRWWSIAGALLFGFLYYNTMRALGHLLLGLTYTVPWAILTTWLIATRHRIKPFSRAWKFCVFTAFLMGVSNPYYLNMFIQLLLIALVMQWFAKRQRETLQTGAICLLTSAAGFLIAHTGALLFRLGAGGNPYAIARTYREAEMYALRPIELFVPPMGHRLSWLSDIGIRYQNETVSRGELFSPYLGIIGIFLLILLTGFGLYRLLRNQAHRVSLAFWQIAWIVAYSVIGGINCWLAWFGIGLFRASNRYSLFIAAILLLWSIPKLSRLTKTWPKLKLIGLAALITLVAISDQLPYAAREKKRPQIIQNVKDDRTFSQAVEARLPEQAMVFQLPLSVFPEGNPVMDMGAYEHLRPYYYTKSLRFSYGSNKGRSDSSWQAETERLPASAMVKRLESLGFHALMINRKGFADDGNGLINNLAALGYKDGIENQAKDLVAIFLHPAKEFELPRTDRHAINNYGHFWRRFDTSTNDVLWVSQAYAEIQINRDVIQGRKAHLRAQISVPSDRTISFLIGNVVLAKKLLSKDIIHHVEFDFDIPKNGQLLRIDTDRPQTGFQNSEVLTGTFALMEMEITPLP